jgi:hypothetical protein
LNLAQLRIAPHAFLIRSCWPIYSVWQYNTTPNAPKPPAQAQDVLVVRPNFDPHPVLLPPGGATLFESLQQGLNFFEAASVAQDQQTDFDLAAVLTLLLSENVLSEIIPKANKRRLL